MRAAVTAVLLAASACSKPQQPAPQGPAATSFDGAQATDAAALRTHGYRVATMLGCTGCHGKNLQGDLFEDDPKFGTLYAPNLSLVLRDYSDAEIETLLRQGRRPNGRDVWFMPSETFQHLSGPDMHALIAYLRSVPQGGKPLPPAAVKKGAWGEIQGAVMVPAAEIAARTRDALPADLGEGHALGRYITSVTCGECHGHRLEGTTKLTPDLMIASAYSREEFETLMTKGVPSGGRKLKNPLMGEVARERFVHFTPHERDALYAYLKARAEKP